jgi:hypothetical protein
MYPLDRTHPLSRELDWLPPSLKARRWWTSGLTWAATAGGATALTVASMGALAHLALLGAVGGFVAGDRAGRARLRRGLERLAHGRFDLVRLDAAAEGHLVHVAGRVVSASPLASVLHQVPAVYRRLTFRHRWRRWLHEAAVDFDLVDASGAHIRVLVDGAQLFAPAARQLADYPVAALATRPLSPSLQRLWGAGAAHLAAAGDSLAAAEIALPPGTRVEIIGEKTGTVDPTAAPSPGGRAPPMRASLRSGQIPLIITPAGEAPDDDA